MEPQHLYAQELRTRAELVHDGHTANVMLEAADLIDRLCELITTQQAELHRMACTPLEA